MEKRMKEYQTPQRDPAANRRSRKPQKIAKSLAATFSSLSDDKVQPISMEDFSPIYEVSDINQVPDMDRSFLQVVNPALSASFESSFFPDLSPSSVVTAENEQTDKIPVNFAGSNDLVKGSACSVEAEIAVDFLRRALSQVLQSTDVDHQSKKLLDASMRIIVEDFVAIPQEQDHIAQLISAKSLVLSLCFFLWIIILALAFFFGSGAKSSFSGPPPT
ncbi:uncharacterized protein LOC111009828 [Momordica charantia]|uniref:Uncharacterized protein LOC111009828 n=1 Tax=Momordica charantia TaxID=3673 RepID=A0A6J1CAA2_MOMCH|nr:uncharacterized protein LOC111009828 [Momordica charantia]